jgi:LysM repeat protein
MNKRNSAIARILAALALAAAVVAVIVVVGGATGDSDSGSKGRQQTGGTVKKQPKPKPKSTAKTYTVESGDTLTVIAEKTGVTVTELRELNPEVDPQILEIGEVLKLR